MPSDRPRLNVVLPPRLHAELQRTSQAREQTVSEITREALRKEIVRKDFPITNRAAPRKEDSK